MQKRKGRVVSRSKAAALFAVVLACWWSSTASAQLDPLLFIKRVPPTIIVVFDTSMRMLEDGSGNWYDPNFYRVTDDAAVMPSFPNINIATTKTYRRDRDDLSKRNTGALKTDATDLSDKGSAVEKETVKTYKNGRDYAKTTTSVKKH